MLTIKCPKCGMLMKLKPPNGPAKVNCPKCAAVLQIGGPKTATKRMDAAESTPSGPRVAKEAAAKEAAAKKTVSKTVKKPVKTAPTQPVVATAPSVPAGDVDPFAAPTENPFLDVPGDPFATAGPTASVDADPFAALPDVGAAVAGASVFQGGPLHSAASVAAPDTAPTPTATSQPAKQPTKSGGKKLGLVIGISVGVVAFVGAAAVVGAIARRSGTNKSTAASAAPSEDSGSSTRVGRMSFAFPDGTEFDVVPTAARGKAWKSAETGAIYFVGMGSYEFKNPSSEQIALRAGKIMMAQVRGGMKVERDGHSGQKARSLGGILYPSMQTECFLIGDKVYVIGCGMPPRKLPKPTVVNPPPPPPPTAEELEKRELFKAESAAFFESVKIHAV
ncbi:MAG: hypothetical protein AAFX06_18285 [Planctomycetota bacterium]